MQFAVPQFTDVEDRIIGPLTIKQFLILLAAGGIILFLWSVKIPGIIFFPIAFVAAVAGLGMAFGKYNGRPAFSYMVPFFNFLINPKLMIYQREEPILIARIEKKETTKPLQTIKDVQDEPAESRLKKLAYLLDKKTQEEEELMLNKKQ